MILLLMNIFFLYSPKDLHNYTYIEANPTEISKVANFWVGIITQKLKPTTNTFCETA